MAESAPTSTQEIKTYHGNCHCGAFKFSLKVPEIKKIVECNCSICFKKGYKWLFPKAGEFTIEKGEGSLTEYEFGQRATVHKFCPTCGTALLQERKAVPPDMRIAINARALMDVDLWSLEVVPYDGTERAPKYIPAPFTGSEPSAIVSNPKIYTGSCHCGAVTLAMKTNGPLPDGGEYLQECDCSICARNGTILIYPHPAQVTISTSRAPASAPALTPYAFGPRTQQHQFCSTCGAPVYIARVACSAAEFAKWHSSGYETWLDKQAVNLRLFEGVEWEAVTVKKAFWSRSEPVYVCPA